MDTAAVIELGLFEVGLPLFEISLEVKVHVTGPGWVIGCGGGVVKIVVKGSTELMSAIEVVDRCVEVVAAGSIEDTDKELARMRDERDGAIEVVALLVGGNIPFFDVVAKTVEAAKAVVDNDNKRWVMVAVVIANETGISCVISCDGCKGPVDGVSNKATVLIGTDA